MENQNQERTRAAMIQKSTTEMGEYKVDPKAICLGRDQQIAYNLTQNTLPQI